MSIRSLLAIGLLALSGAASAGIVTTNHSNTQYIAINDGQPANPFPSAINITGLRGSITNVTVTLNGFGHSWPGDVHAWLVSPSGQSIELMPHIGGSGDVWGASFTFTPTSGPWGYVANLSALNGAAAAQNGNWQLFVSDDAWADVGSIANGWTVSITRNTFTTCAAEGFSGAKLTLCRQVCELNQGTTLLSAYLKAWMAMYRTEPPCAN